MRQLALKRALVDQATEGGISLIEEWSLKSHKTGEFVKLLKLLGTPSKTLIIDENLDNNLTLAARNLANVKVSSSTNVNALDIVGVDQIVCSVSGINSLVNKFSSSKN
jgi:large subunit ribosomal protein L4